MDENIGDKGESDSRIRVESYIDEKAFEEKSGKNEDEENGDNRSEIKDANHGKGQDETEDIAQSQTRVNTGDCIEANENDYPDDTLFCVCRQPNNPSEPYAGADWDKKSARAF